MPRFVRSASYPVLLDAAADFLKSLAGFPEILIVAQSRGAADDFVRTHCGAGFTGVHRTTLIGLAVDLAAAPLAREGLSKLGALSSEALVARIIHELKSKSLDYFREVAATPGLPRAVARSIAELRLQSVSAEQVSQTGPPGQDLAAMAAAFERELSGNSAADFALLVRYAIAAAREGKHRLLGHPILVLDVDLDSTLLRQFAGTVLGHAPRVFVAGLTGASKNLQAWETLLGHASDNLDISTGRITLERVRARLFLEDGGAARGESDSSLEYFSAAGEALECVEIARRISKLAAEGGRFDKIAVVLRSPERYQPLVQEALRRAGIPAYYSRGVARPDPAGRAFLALLACAAEGCSATRFAEYLSLGQVPPIGRQAKPEDWPLPPPEDEVLRASYEAGENQQPVTEPEDDPDAAVVSGTLQSPAAWEKLLVDAAVIGGRDRWSRRLRGLEAEYRSRLADLGQKEEGRREHLLREIERLRNLEGFALPLIDLLSGLPRQAAWGEWLQQLETLAASSLRHPESVLSVLSELEVMADVGPVGLEEVTGVLSDRLRFLRPEPPLRRYGQVFVAGTDEIRGRSFDVVFLPGLCEGSFPSRPTEDPILLDTYRRQLDAGLRLQNERVAAERLRLHIACGAARSRLVFSYPRMDVAQSRPRVPSFYALEIVRAAYGKLPELRTFEEKARKAAPSRLDWPGPFEPNEAIDDAEFDLAVLGPTVAPNAKNVKAAGRYLIEEERTLPQNGNLVRSLRWYARRARPGWSSADGIFEPDDATRALLATQRLGARSYSPSALQHYATCPYQFVLYAVHQLRPREETVALEQMDPLTRGALFHEAQFRLFTELRSLGLLPMRTAELTRLQEIADSVLERVAGENAEKLAPAIARVWRSEIDDLRTDLRGWIEHAAAEDLGWIPEHFEFCFGTEGRDLHDPASTSAEAVLDGGARLRGAIDLVERHAVRGTLRITDHKTGKRPHPIPKYVGGGALLQPLAYGIAAENLLGAPAEVSRLFYCTQRGGYDEYRFDITPQTKRWFVHAMSIIDGEIERGFLPAAPQEGACAQCDFVAVCGPGEERRTSRKRKEALEQLQTLRNIP